MTKITLPSAGLISLLPHKMLSQDRMQVKEKSLFLSLEDAVKPGMIEEYIETTKEWIKILKYKNIKTSFSTFLETNDIVNYLEPIDSMPEADESSLYEEVESFQNSDAGKKRASTIRWSKYSIWAHSDQLSYKPTNPKVPPNAFPYFVWKHICLPQQKESTFIDTAKKFKEIFQKHNVERSYGFFWNIIGYKRPWYTVIFPGKDPEELNNWLHVMERDLGLELKPLLDRLYNSIEQLIDGNGWSIPDLSIYLPQ
jgi:hypothetical protein